MKIFKLTAIMLLILSLSQVSYAAEKIQIPQDNDWREMVTSAKSATSGPYNPGAASGVVHLPMYDQTTQQYFTSFQIRLRYAAAETITTSPKIRCYARKGTDYQPLKDVAEADYWNTFNEAASDVTDGTYKWTSPSPKIDALGGQAAVCVVDTDACVTSSTGGCVLEGARY